MKYPYIGQSIWNKILVLFYKPEYGVVIKNSLHQGVYDVGAVSSTWNEKTAFLPYKGKFEDA